MLTSRRDGSARRVFLPLVIAGIVSVFPLSSCNAQDSEVGECRGHALYRECAITEGEYLTFSIGMSIESAFEAACSLIESGALLSRPVVYSESEGVNYRSNPFCEKKSAVVNADYWSFVEPGNFREKRVRLQFRGGELASIHVGFRGLDP
jgi:hypothetical protein